MFILAFYLACMGAIVIFFTTLGPQLEKSVQWQTTSQGNLQAIPPGTLTVIAYQTIPILIGTISTLLYRTIWQTLLRMNVYVCLAATKTQRGVKSRLWPALYPQSFPFYGPLRWLLRFMSLSIPIVSLISPIKSAFNYGDPTPTWILYYLITIYSLLIFFTAVTILRMWNLNTGLRWEASTLADHLALLHQSNILCDFHGLECASHKQLRNAINSHTYRLGYWRKGVEGKQTIWYGLGRHNDGGSRRVCQDMDGDSAASDERLGSMSGDPYLQTPTILSDKAMIFWFLLIYLSLAGLVYLWASRNLEGFQLSTKGSTYLQFLLTSIASLVGILWLNVDVYHRAIQPYVGMNQTPKPATENLLLGYLQMLPVEVTFRALKAGHYRVAYFSFLAFATTLFPALAGSLFALNSTSNGESPSEEALNGFFNETFVSVSTHSYVGVLVFVIIYAISLPFATVGSERRLSTLR